MRLDELKPGESAVIVSLKHEGLRLQRLLEMGLFEGGAITLVRRAPLGDPIEVRLTDYNLSLRQADAMLIEVKP
ncbi:MAG: FeoA family protein [candidate division FCPU426 bacterium]